MSDNHTPDELPLFGPVLPGGTVEVLPREQLATGMEGLASMTSERDDLQAKLTATDNELAGVRTTLDDAQDRLNLQSGQIETLKTCLSGVNEALGAVLEYDYSAAVGSLRAVQTACKTAFALF